MTKAEKTNVSEKNPELVTMEQLDESKKEKPAMEKVTEIFKDAPVQSIIPYGWEINEKGIFYIDNKTDERINISGTPILITGRIRNNDTKEEKIEIAFRRDNKWNKALMKRSELFSASKILRLADLGCMITSENAKYMVSFLSALEAENDMSIPKTNSVGTFGWYGKDRFILGPEKDIVMDIDPCQQYLLSALCQKGSLKGWIDLMRPYREKDGFRFALAAGFAAPLLRILKERNIIVYFWEPTRSGKTACEKAALSAWGDPETLLISFNATQVGLEKTAGLFRDLPLGVDEKQVAGQDQRKLEGFIYMLANGKGRLRGTKFRGIQQTLDWRTVVLSSGEEPFASATSQSGVNTRILEITGKLFNDEKSASQLHKKVSENCGWAGPEYIRRVIAAGEENIKGKYVEMQDFVDSLADGTAGPHVNAIAVIALADAMIDTWLFKGQDADGLQIDPESWSRAKKMAETVLKEQMAMESPDVNENAVQYIYEWVLTNKSHFKTGESTRVADPVLGLMDSSEDIVWIFSTKLEEALNKAGYNKDETVHYMAENGLIRQDSQKKNSVTKKYGGKPIRCMEFHIGEYAASLDEDKGDAEAAHKESGISYQQELSL